LGNEDRMALGNSQLAVQHSWRKCGDCSSLTGVFKVPISK